MAYVSKYKSPPLPVIFEKRYGFRVYGERTFLEGDGLLGCTQQLKIIAAFAAEGWEFSRKRLFPPVFQRRHRTITLQEHSMITAQRKRQQFIAGLRAVATFYETHPDAYYDGMHLTLNMYVWGPFARKTLAKTAKFFKLCKKRNDDRNVTVSRQFGEQVTLSVFAPRSQVCRRIVLEVNASYPPLSFPRFSLKSSPRSNQIVEWHCDPLLRDYVTP